MPASGGIRSTSLRRRRCVAVAGWLRTVAALVTAAAGALAASTAPSAQRHRPMPEGPTWLSDVWVAARAESVRDVLRGIPAPPAADAGSAAAILEHVAARGVRVVADRPTFWARLERQAGASDVTAADALERAIRVSHCQVRLIDGVLCLRSDPGFAGLRDIASHPYIVDWASGMCDVLDSLPMETQAAIAHRLPVHIGAPGGREFLSRSDLLPDPAWGVDRRVYAPLTYIPPPASRRRWGIVFEPTVQVSRNDKHYLTYPVNLLHGGEEALAACLGLAPEELAVRYEEARLDARLPQWLEANRAALPDRGGGPDILVEESVLCTLPELAGWLRDAGLPCSLGAPDAATRVAWVGAGSYAASTLVRAAGWSTGLRGEVGAEGARFMRASARIPATLLAQWHLFTEAQPVPFALEDILAGPSMRWRDLTEQQERYLRGRFAAAAHGWDEWNKVAPEILRVAFVPGFRTMECEVLKYRELDDPGAVGYWSSWIERGQLVWPAD